MNSIFRRFFRLTLALLGIANLGVETACSALAPSFAMPAEIVKDGVLRLKNQILDLDPFLLLKCLELIVRQRDISQALLFFVVVFFRVGFFGFSLFLCCG